MESFKEHLEWEDGLKPGDPVKVNWGYGLGFRASGKGVVTRIFAKSVRVKLTEDVGISSSYGFDAGWTAGFELKGIPRVFGNNWIVGENGVELLEEGK